MEIYYNSCIKGCKYNYNPIKKEFVLNCNIVKIDKTGMLEKIRYSPAYMQIDNDALDGGGENGNVL